jgi:hypothetical protein
VNDRLVCRVHTRRSSTHSDKYQVSYWYSYFSWWWAHSCPKHVQNTNKHTKKELCTRLVLFTRLVSFYHTVRMLMQKFMSLTAPAHQGTHFVINNIAFYFFSNTSQPLMVDTRKIKIKFTGITNSNCTPYIHSLVIHVLTRRSHHHQRLTVLPYMTHPWQYCIYIITFTPFKYHIGIQHVLCSAHKSFKLIKKYLELVCHIQIQYLLQN